MREAVRDYISRCNTCQPYNYENVSPAGKIIPIKVTYPLKYVGLDLIGPYLLYNTYRFIFVLVIVDYFCKWMEFGPLRKAFAKTVADAFLIILFLNMVHQ